MARTPSIGIREELHNLISDDRLDAIARETGVVERDRKIVPPPEIPA